MNSSQKLDTFLKDVSNYPPSKRRTFSAAFKNCFSKIVDEPFISENNSADIISSKLTYVSARIFCTQMFLGFSKKQNPTDVKRVWSILERIREYEFKNQFYYRESFDALLNALTFLTEKTTIRKKIYCWLIK